MTEVRQRAQPCSCSTAPGNPRDIVVETSDTDPEERDAVVQPSEPEPEVRINAFFDTPADKNVESARETPADSGSESEPVIVETLDTESDERDAIGQPSEPEPETRTGACSDAPADMNVESARETLADSGSVSEPVVVETLDTESEERDAVVQPGEPEPETRISASSDAPADRNVETARESPADSGSVSEPVVVETADPEPEERDAVVQLGEPEPEVRINAFSDAPADRNVETARAVLEDVGSETEPVVVDQIEQPQDQSVIGGPKQSEETEDPTPGRGSDVEQLGENPLISSVSELLPGEKLIYNTPTHGKGGSEVVLTDRRVLLRGGEDAKFLHASMRFEEIDAVTIERVSPSRRSLIWGLVGIAASVGVWQALDGVGNVRLIMAAVVVVMSAVLLADFFLRPPDLEVSLRAKSGVEMKVGFAQSHSEQADSFTARVLSMMELRER